MRKRTRTQELSLCTGGIVAGGIFLAALAVDKSAKAQNVTGSLTGGSATQVNYGSNVPGTGALTTQSINTGFGDSTIGDGTSSGGSELDAMYGTVQNGYLYLFFAGNLENNGNLLNVFIDDGRANGQNTLNAPQGAGSMQNMKGSVFSPGFNATYAFEANDSGGTFFMDQFNLLPGGVGSFVGQVGLTGGKGSNQNLGGSGIKVGVNNTNISTMGASGAAANQTAAQAVSTGFEFGIPLSTLGNPTGNILVMADINGSGNPPDNFLSNQFLPGLPVGTQNVGGGGPYTVTTATGTGAFNVASLSNFWITVPQTVVPNGIWLPTGSGNWDNGTTANWSNGAIPNAAGATADFSSAGASATVTIVGTKTVGTLSINDSNSYTFAAGAGGALTLDNGGSTATANVIDTDGNHTIDVPITLNSNANLSVLANGSVLTIAGNISGGGSLVISSLGANGRLNTVSNVVLSGNNTYQGDTEIQKGVLQLGSNTAIPVGNALILDSMTSPEGTLDMNGFNATISSLTANVGAFNGNTQIINSSTLAVTSTLTYAGTNANPSTYPGNIVDNASTGGATTALTVSSGSLTLTGANTNAGLTTVNSGATLALASTAGTSLPSGGNVQNNGSLVVNDTLDGRMFGNNTADVAGNISGSGITTINSGMALQAINFTQGGVVNNGTLTVLGSGTVGPISGAGTLNVSGALQLAASSGLSQMASLNVSGAGTFDINNNHVIVNYNGESDPISSIAALLATGYNEGSWNGVGGIISTAAQVNNAVHGNLLYGVGYADSADSGNPAGLASGTLEIKYTLLGDANLSGVVDGTDFGIVAANFNKGVTGWDQGDFNYDNVVDGTDFGDLAANFNKGASGASVGLPAWADPAIVAFAEAHGLMADLTSIPEPASMGLMTLGVVGMLAKRRRGS